MSRRDRYPEIIYQRMKPGARCKTVDCNNPATYRVEIRSTYMRGDDDVFALCHICRAAARGGNPSTWVECERVYKMTGNYHGDSTK